jgi:hypothetical protein
MGLGRATPAVFETGFDRGVSRFLGRKAFILDFIK